MSNAEDSSPAIPETRWSLVRRAGADDTIVRNTAIDELIQRYIPVIHGYFSKVRRIPAPAVEDLVQGFLANKIIEQQMLRHADSARGRFRNFLFTALDHYAISVYRSDQASKRAPNGITSLENVTELAAKGPTPNASFDVLWARQTLSHVLEQMRLECEVLGRPDIWGVFEARVLRPIAEHTEPMPYDELIAQFGLKSPMQASNVLVSAKRMFVRTLRKVIAETTDDAEIDDEISDLKRILAQSR